MEHREVGMEPSCVIEESNLELGVGDGCGVKSVRHCPTFDGNGFVTIGVLA
jgi:hypothetical protein